MLRIVGGEREIIKDIQKKRRNSLGHTMRGECLFRITTDGTVEGKGKENILIHG